MESKFDYFFKLVLLGDAGVGKTSLLLRIADALTESYNNTLIDHKVRYLSLEGKIVKLEIHDCPHDLLATSYYRATHGFFLVYDVTDKASYQNVQQWLKQIRLFASEKVGILLVGNKSDLLDNKTVDAREVQKFAEFDGIPFIETSAKRATNVETALLMLAAEAKKHEDAVTRHNAAQHVPPPLPRRSSEKSLWKLFKRRNTFSVSSRTPQNKPSSISKSSETVPSPNQTSLLSSTSIWPANLNDKWPKDPSHDPPSNPPPSRSRAPTLPDLSGTTAFASAPAILASASVTLNTPSPNPSGPHVVRSVSLALTRTTSSKATSSFPSTLTSSSVSPLISTSATPTLTPHSPSSTSAAPIRTSSVPTLTRIPSAYSSTSSASLITSPPSTLTASPSSPISPTSLRGAHGVLLIPSSQFEFSSNHEIGMGAQGVTYKTKWKSRDVVFKKLFAHQDSKQKQSFLRELEVWRNIHHANSVALFGAVDDSNILGYVMEYCANGNLQDHMKKGLVLSPMKTADVACKIADILSVLHDSYIAHRDVKSSNIMLDQDFNPKLGDFGLSQMHNSNQASATNLAGTPTHMAPEQYVSGAKHDPFKADVYSFGMLMYELATNQVPFHGLNQFEIYKNLERGARPLIAIDTPVGMEEAEQKIWWEILTQCWEQDPLARPSMSDVHHRLRRLLKTMSDRIQGFCCKAHKTGHHDFFLSYRVATESNIVHKLYHSLTQTKRTSGADIKVFLDAKCLPDAEDWQRSFLYGLHHTKIIIPVISIAALAHFHKAHEENDNVLLEYEHMLSLLTLRKGKVKVFPIFVGKIPRASDYSDLPHITTGKSISKTLEGILRLQGVTINVEAVDEVIPALLKKLDELDSGVNALLNLSADMPDLKLKEEHMMVFIQVEGEPQRDVHVEVNPETTLESLRKLIEEELDDLDFEFRFLKITAESRAAEIGKKQENSRMVKDIIDKDSNVTLRKRK